MPVVILAARTATQHLVLDQTLIYPLGLERNLGTSNEKR